MTTLDTNYLQTLNANLWTSYVPENFVATNSQLFLSVRERSVERREEGSRLAGTGTWDRWRKGQSRESVTHEEMMERFAALSKQLLSFGHIWTGRFCCFATRNFQQPELSRQTLSAWSMAANKPVSSQQSAPNHPHLFTFSHKDFHLFQVHVMYEKFNLIRWKIHISTDNIDNIMFCWEVLLLLISNIFKKFYV